MYLRATGWLGLLFTLVLAATDQVWGEAPRPNIVFIVADDK